MHSVSSTDDSSPVIAEVTDDVPGYSGELVISAKTRAIGSARFDASARRIQIRFQTLVDPDGMQHAIQAVGMMPDGSSGVLGDYHSGEAGSEAGQFLGHFGSAMATGMMDRQGGGPIGTSYEPGSLKNGLLSGVSGVADDEAKMQTQALTSTKPTMTLPKDTLFVLFLEREYYP